MIAATVTRPTVETTAIRSPVMMYGSASGNSTFITRCVGVSPIPSAASRTAAGTASNPAIVFVTRISSV